MSTDDAHSYYGAKIYIILISHHVEPHGMLIL